MAELIDVGPGVGLGRLCKGGGDAIHAAPAYPGIDRIEAQFSGEAYARHRHDTYAVGITMRGIQTFWYRGRQRASQPGQIIVLHPDEVHDGGAGTEDGLEYRMLYIEPALLMQSLRSAGSLPFIAEPVIDDPGLRQALLGILGDMDGEIDTLLADQVTTDLSEGLSRHAQLLPPRKAALALPALERVRDFLDAASLEQVRSEELEAIAGMDRFTLTRQFKAAFATSPHRYLIMRRVGHGRQLLAGGHAIADVAAMTGFADQSHFHRHFLRTFGMTPGRWQRLAFAANGMSTASRG